MDTMQALFSPSEPDAPAMTSPQPEPALGNPPTDESSPSTVTPESGPGAAPTAAEVRGAGELQISIEDYRALQEQLAERDRTIDQIKRMAAEQEARDRAAEAQAHLRGSLKEQVVSVMDMDDPDRATEQLFGFINGILQNVASTYQQQMSQYEQDVREAFWAATAPGLADDLIRQYGLPQEIREDLLHFTNDHAMKDYALRVKATIDSLAARTQQQVVSQEIQQRQESGVQAMGQRQGVAPMEIQPGTSHDLMPVLRGIFNMTR